jgi:hypothetical protein
MVQVISHAWTMADDPYASGNTHIKEFLARWSLLILFMELTPGWIPLSPSRTSSLANGVLEGSASLRRRRLGGSSRGDAGRANGPSGFVGLYAWPRIAYITSWRSALAFLASHRLHHELAQRACFQPLDRVFIMSWRRTLMFWYTWIWPTSRTLVV